MSQDSDFSSGWTFVEGFEPHWTDSEQHGVRVDLPHNAVELPLAYGDERAYQRAFTYQKRLSHDEAFDGQRVRLRFEGAMADAEVFLNGTPVAAHSDGYTPFEVDLSEVLNAGDVLITVRIDGRENPRIPPFGGQIDYLTYAGLYRDVRLRISPVVAIAHVRADARMDEARRALLDVTATLCAPADAERQAELQAELLDDAGAVVADCRARAHGEHVAFSFDSLAAIVAWDIHAPTLYTLVLTLRSPAGIDVTRTTLGFRHIAFDANGFRLNGRTLKLAGLNRHQSFPYAGYALGRGPQERDAEIIKHELGCNVVRSSHYPACPWFLDHCDRIGLLVLEEIPGWQHIGDEHWTQASLANVRNMIERDRHHPSIISWGVRINESVDDHAFYSASNALARQLDPHRPTSGIRCHESSELLEDVYTMNDFVQGSEVLSATPTPRRALRGVREVTGLEHDVAYLVTEYNGHMFPTKAADPEEHQNEHVMRHLNVLEAMYADPQIAGCVGWCAFDYQTHADFGAGDRICHHGVMTMFREPKFAASVYASQADPRVRPVLTPVTRWARGERAMGGVLPLTVLTNLDEVELRFEDTPWQRFLPAVQRFPHLPHPPVIIERSDLDSDAIGSWGLGWRGIEMVGYLDGEAVASTRFVADPVPTMLAVQADKQRLAADQREEVRIAVRALDQVDNPLAYLNASIDIALEGPAQLMGPRCVPLLAGACAFWVRATGTGTIRARVTAPSLPDGTVELIAD